MPRPPEHGHQTLAYAKDTLEMRKGQNAVSSPLRLERSYVRFLFARIRFCFSDLVLSFTGFRLNS
jgi:hypothetical protein